MFGSTINTSTLNVSTLNGGPYGFSTIVSTFSTVTNYTNSTLFTIPLNTSTIIFTLVGAGGGGSTGGGGGGAGVTLTVNNPSNSQFALYPGIFKNNTIFGGGMSMLFSTNGATTNAIYTCMAIAAGGGAGGTSGGYGGGSGGSGGSGNPGAAGLNGLGGIGGGFGLAGSPFLSIGPPPIFSTITFPTISVGGVGGSGAGGSAGGDGYGGGGGGNVGAGGGGNYAYSDNNKYISSVINGNNGTGGNGGSPGITIGTYGVGGNNGLLGNSGVIQVTIISIYTTQSFYNLIPTTNQTLGITSNPWSNIFTSSITTGGSFIVSPLKSGIFTPNLYYNTSSNEIVYNVSMAKYKSNIADLSLDTETIYNLNPREYDYLDGKHCVGFIAEEVDEIDTMLSAKNDDGTPENINWFGLTTYLVQEMKKMNKRLKMIENVISKN